MSNTYAYAAIAEAMISAINAAWVPATFAAIEIQHDTEPKTIQQISGGAFINLRPLEVKSDPRGPNAGLVSVDDLYRFEIIVYFPMPAATGMVNANVPFLKMGYASLLRAQLQTSSGTFAGVANLPYVTGADLRDRNPGFEGACSMRLTFECRAQSSYH